MLAIALLAAAMVGCAEKAARFERVVLIVVDTLRRDHVWPYDRAAQTPNIRRLAEGGQVYDNAIASFHQTTMSMAALFTGRTPSLEAESRGKPLAWNGRNWCGMTRFDASATADCLPASVDTLAEELAAENFWTIGIASNVFLYRPAGFDRGFADWVQLGTGQGNDAHLEKTDYARSRQGTRVTTAAIEALQRRPRDRFFLYVHYMDAHDWAWMGRRDYTAGVAAADAAIGPLIDYLESQGLLENTLLVLTSDHGEMLESDRVLKWRRSHFGNPSYEPVLEIPLIVAPPLGDSPSEPLRSEDLRALLRRRIGLPAAPREGVLSPDEQLFTENSWQTYRKWPWKSAWSRKDDTVYLFDLRTEQAENRDLSQLHPEVLQRHRSRIDALSEQLRAEGVREQELSEEDAARLRALGYAD